MTDPRNDSTSETEAEKSAVPPVPPAPPENPYVPSSAPGYAVPPQAPDFAPPQAPGYVAAQPAPGYSPPQAPGYVAPQQAPGYAPPQAPASPAGAPAGVAYPAGAYPVATPPRGLLPWALGLLIFIPFPFVGGLASGIAMAVSGGASRRFGGVARENARVALNWGLTYLLVSTGLLITHFLVLFTLTTDSPSSGFYPIGIPITLYFAVSVLHVVLVIIGMVKASAGKVIRVPFAIPYLRR
jgi:hypothetical protein